jgi:hypothetical protein
MFRATFTSPNSASGQFEDEDMSTYTIIDAFDTLITPTGADDFQTSQSLMGNHVNDFHYHRMVEDVPCEISNPHHIFRDEALQRGDIYLLENDPITANCWFILQRSKAIAMPARNTEDPSTTGVAFRRSCPLSTRSTSHLGDNYDTLSTRHSNTASLFFQAHDLDRRAVGTVCSLVCCALGP